MGYIGYRQQTGLLWKEQDAGKLWKRLWRIIPELSAFPIPPYKLLWLTEGDITLNRYEWKDEVEILVNPEDEYYSSFFLNKWNRKWWRNYIPAVPPWRKWRRWFKPCSISSKTNSNHDSVITGIRHTVRIYKNAWSGTLTIYPSMTSLSPKPHKRLSTKWKTRSAACNSCSAGFGGRHRP